MIFLNVTSSFFRTFTFLLKQRQMNRVLWQQYGLSEINGKRIMDVFSRFSEVQEAVLFGSRAKGNYRQGSDIDIAVKGTVSKDVLSALLVAFDETVLPYFVDIVVYDHIKNIALIRHYESICHHSRLQCCQVYRAMFVVCSEPDLAGFGSNFGE